MKLTIDKSFRTRTEITERTVKVAEAFGIGVDDEHEFKVFDNFQIEINPGDVVYITGDSGSGKSILLKTIAFAADREPDLQPVVNINSIFFDKDKPLIESIGDDLPDAITKLSMVGLNEAFLMLRKYDELSDGQKYRYLLANLIDSYLIDQKDNSRLPVKTWIADEFCSVLDRTTAKVVAYTMAKTARKLGKTMIVATAHGDLFLDLNPDLYVHKFVGHEVGYERRKFQEHPHCSLLRHVLIADATRDDYDSFEQFHYRGGITSATGPMFKATLDDEIIGIIVYGPALAHIRARSIALPWLATKGATETAKLELLSRIVKRIWRVVVAPKYRSIGLGAKLVRDTMPLVNVPYVESMAVMAHYNPFFEKAGMTKLNPELYLDYDNEQLAAQNVLVQHGFDLNLLGSRTHTMSVLQRLDAKDLNKVRDAIVKGFISFKHNQSSEAAVQGGDIEEMAKVLQKHPAPYAYVIWKNPKFTDYPDPVVA